MNYSTEIDPYLKIICFPSFEGAHCGCILSNEYLDYYNSRIRAKLKGLPPAIHRQQALSAA